MKKITLILSMMIALIGLNANAAIYIVGDNALGGWTYNGGNEMTDDGTGVYTYNMAIPSDADYAAVYFVFADGQGESWDDFNGNLRIGPTNGNVDVTAGQWINTQKAGGDKGAYKFMVTKGETYTITYNANETKFMVAGYVAPVEVETYSVVGGFNSWNTNSAEDVMTLVNGVYTLNKQNLELQVGKFEYKFIGNHDYGIYQYPHDSSNLSETVEKHGYYDVAFTFDPETETATCTLTLVEEIIDVEDPIYTVTGSSAALFGAEWNEALLLEQNEMTKGQDGIYTWTKNNVELTAGNIEFKVVLGHAWGTEYPSSNYVATIAEDGTYDVTITFNPADQAITFTATASVPVEDFYTVAGAPASLFGAEWDAEYAANNMELKDGIYTWSKDSVQLAAETFIEFKVVKNANWDTCWPASNYEYTVAEDGIYNLVITYNPVTNAVTFTCEVPGEEPPVEMVYTVVGPESIFGSNWAPTDVANDMVKGEDGVYTWIKENVTLTGNFSFKVVGNHDYAVYEWPMGFDNNYDVTVEQEGIYTIKITFNPEAEEDNRITCELTKTGDIATAVRGDADGNGVVGMDDLSAMISYLVYGTPVSAGAAICDDLGSTAVTMDDLSALINYLVYGTWPAEPVVEHVYTVAGTENLFGSNWNPADEANDMVKGNDGIYTWTKENVEFTEYATIEFKVVEDHSWDNSAWPSSNWWAEITEPGMYNFVITFDPTADDMSKITYTATKQVVE